MCHAMCAPLIADCLSLLSIGLSSDSRLGYMQLLLFAIGALGDEFQVIVVERHGEAVVIGFAQRQSRPGPRALVLDGLVGHL